MKPVLTELIAAERDRLEVVDWRQALNDVSPFLERRQDAALVSQATLLSLLNAPEGRIT